MKNSVVTFIFCAPPPPPPRLLITGESFQPEFETYTYADFFAISQKDWSVCSVFCFAS